MFHLILRCDELPYDCPLISRNVLTCDDIEDADFEPITLNEDFIQATFTAWKRLVQDPLIFDVVEMDSQFRLEEFDADEIVIVR